jgi:hypothetical protein
MNNLLYQVTTCLCIMSLNIYIYIYIYMYKLDSIWAFIDKEVRNLI